MYKDIFFQLLCGLMLFASACSSADSPRQVLTEQESWQQTVKETLPHFGHRNWIVIADGAYPLQSNPGIRTIAIDADQLEAAEFLQKEIANAPHVMANIYVDKEMQYLTETLAPGIGTYREEMKRKLGDQLIDNLLHEEIIQKLDESADLFHVLILKTDLAIPYTSVFFQLECGYWDESSENKLRTLIPD